ncbi:MAG TPA: hypothetical protein VNW30_08190 [Opitutaceae bacterium]|jgi:hypothetical protein|nr:hypothetical protein [Opitutaceae bacterium]
MDLSPRLLETGFLAVLAAWTLGSVVFALPLWRWRQRLRRWNQGLWFAHWAVFDSGRGQAEICVYSLEYCDRLGSGGEWVEAISGRPWTWHACLWQPQRRLADRIHRIGQDLLWVAERDQPAAAWLAAIRKVVGNHLAAARPQPAGTVREIRIQATRSVVTAGADPPVVGWGVARQEKRVLLQFTAGEDDHGR